MTENCRFMRNSVYLAGVGSQMWTMAPPICKQSMELLPQESNKYVQTASMRKSFSLTCMHAKTHANQRACYKQTPTKTLRSRLRSACHVELACYIISPETERRRKGRERDSLSHARLHCSPVVRGM